LDSSGSGQGPMAGCCEPSGSVKVLGFLKWLTNYQLLKKEFDGVSLDLCCHDGSHSGRRQSVLKAEGSSSSSEVCSSDTQDNRSQINMS
jgi:hypothetical protein